MRVSITEIERHLLRLGGGNQADNMRSLSCFPYCFFIQLTEDEFYDLVFLQNREVLPIAPLGEDRRLRAVAIRALAAGRQSFSPNWNLAALTERLKAADPRVPGFELEPVVLRDTSGSEREFGPWYLQDGSHRSLAYAMALLTGFAMYQPQTAFCATARQLSEADQC